MENRICHIKGDDWAPFREILSRLTPHSGIFVLVDDNTRKYCLPDFREHALEGIQAEVIAIPSGEENKTLQMAEQIWKELMRKEADRNSILINLGGGLICDLGGFAAATFMRGIRCINVPTTLLAQVDAAIGGKTAVDLERIKNQIGVFSQPDGILLRSGFLDTLPKHQLRSGFAEIVKIAIAYDAGLWENIKELQVENIQQRYEIVLRAAGLKEKITGMDFSETGLRRVLNLGHTVGHAIESLYLIKGRGTILHGEAVAAGILVDSYLSVLHSGLAKASFNEIARFIETRFPYVYLMQDDLQEIIALMMHDKKNVDRKINFTLISAPGIALIDQFCEEGSISEALDFYGKRKWEL